MASIGRASMAASIDPSGRAVPMQKLPAAVV
jgi:hypothetical protein